MNADGCSQPSDGPRPLIVAVCWGIVPKLWVTGVLKSTEILPRTTTVLIIFIHQHKLKGLKYATKSVNSALYYKYINTVRQARN